MELRSWEMCIFDLFEPRTYQTFILVLVYDLRLEVQFSKFWNPLTISNLEIRLNYFDLL